MTGQFSNPIFLRSHQSHVCTFTCLLYESRVLYGIHKTIQPRGIYLHKDNQVQCIFGMWVKVKEPYISMSEEPYICD